MNKKILIVTAVLLLGNLFNFANAQILKDTLVDETLSTYVGAKLPAPNPTCNFKSTYKIPIILTPKEVYRSKENDTGRIINFEVKKNVFHNGLLLVAKGTSATGHVETVITQGMNGIPAMIVLDRFNIEGLDSAKMKSYYIKKGLNLTYLVLPIKWALTIFPPTGSLANFIVGFPTKITPRKDVKIYYYPEWNCIGLKN